MTARLAGGRERGQDLVEYALVLLPLLLLMFGIIEFGWAVFAYNSVSNVAREVARCAIIPANSVQQKCIPEAIARWATGLNRERIGIEWERGSRSVTVEATYEHHMILGLIAAWVGGDGTLTFHTEATMRLEGKPSP